MSARYTLFDLNETIGNAKRYSLVNHGPVAYLSTSEECAQYIVKACNAYDTLIGALGQIAYTHEHMSDEQMTENDGYVAVLMRQIARDALASAQGDK